MLPMFTAEAKDLLTGLLKRDVRNLLCVQPQKRIGSGPYGINEIKNHPFFDSIDWQSLANK